MLFHHDFAAQGGDGELLGGPRPVQEVQRLAPAHGLRPLICVLLAGPENLVQRQSPPTGNIVLAVQTLVVDTEE